MIKDIFDYLLSLIKSRIVPLILVFVIMFSVLICRLFSLQIVNGDSYQNNLDSSLKKDMGVSATRGRIYDCNGELLAYNDLAYAVKISDSGQYGNDNDLKNETINNSINSALNIIEEKGDHFSNDLPIEYGTDGTYSFTLENQSTSLLRFISDSYGVAKIGDLTDDQKNVTAQKLVEDFCVKYGINKDEYTPLHMLEIINIRRYMTNNNYSRYMTFTIANEVSDETVAAILENSDELVGITVEEQYVRRYVDAVYCSHIIGYTGTVSSEELTQLKAEDDSYEQNDIVGKAGIEQAMEKYLAGKKGSKEVYVDTVGRITEVINETDSQTGNDVYLTIDIRLQREIYNAIEDELVSILLSHITPGDTKYSGSASSPDIAIPIKEVYFSLIDNNIVSLDKLQTSDSQTANAIKASFDNRKESVISWIENELVDSPTAYGKLSEEEKEYIWYIYSGLLRKNEIIKVDNIDENDSVYNNWINDNTVSLEQLIKHGMSEGWIDMSKLSDSEYSSLNESYNILVNYIISELENDNQFYKKIYKYMINSGIISGKQVCMLLFEQGVLEDDGSYARLSSGSLGSYEFMTNAIRNKQITPAQLALKPCSGSAVMTDPNTGDIKALVSYPGYDNNKLSGTIDAEYYKQLYNDKSSPLLNWATQSKHAPGSTFKPCSAIAGLDTGVITSSTTFNCSGIFDKISPAPKCWKVSGHGSETVITGIRDSCNVFFYNVGYKLAFLKNGTYNSDYGTSILKKYAEELGLATKCGIEITESAPSASNQDSVRSAIGQGNHAYSALNIARYVTTIANSGTVYNLTLVDKVTDYDGNLVYDNSATVANKVEIDQSIWDNVHEGLKLAGQSYSYTSALNMKIAAKSGTAQESKKEPDHSLLMSYAPYDAPEVALAVSITNGYSSSTSIALSAEIYKIYAETKKANPS